jgi:hypothetical protein
MERLNINRYGQWSLEKANKLKFDPRETWHSPAGKAMADWVSDESEPLAAATAKAQIPRMEGAARTRALSKLTAATQHRRNPNTGKLEFLLHRGMSTDEADTHIKDGSVAHPSGTRTSWTPNAKVAHRQAYYEEPKGKVISAWVPEDALHSSIRQYSGSTERHKILARQEDEWIVHHGSSGMALHGIVDGVRPKDLK